MLGLDEGAVVRYVGDPIVVLVCRGIEAAFISREFSYRRRP